MAVHDCGTYLLYLFVSVKGDSSWDQTWMTVYAICVLSTALASIWPLTVHEGPEKEPKILFELIPWPINFPRRRNPKNRLTIQLLTGLLWSALGRTQKLQHHSSRR